MKRILILLTAISLTGCTGTTYPISPDIEARLNRGPKWNSCEQLWGLYKSSKGGTRHAAYVKTRQRNGGEACGGSIGVRRSRQEAEAEAMQECKAGVIYYKLHEICRLVASR